MARVTDDEVLLLWRALRRFRSGRTALCAPRGHPLMSECPLFAACDRWDGPDDERLALEETEDETERRRSRWPCSRVLDLLGPDTSRIS